MKSKKYLSKVGTFFQETREAGVLMALILLVVGFSFASEHFLAYRNILNILRQISQIGIITVAVTNLIISQEFDLSVGSVFAVAGINTAMMMQVFGVHYLLAVASSLVLCALLGLFNGLITVKIGVPSFITTLGTMMVYRGIALLISGGNPISSGLSYDSFFYYITGDRLGGILPAPIIWFLIVAVIGWIILQRTSYGYKVYATGGNTEAAKLSGIPTDRIKITNFMLTSMAAGFAGIISLSFLGSATPTQGAGLELEAIAASVIGGTALFGGKGTILGAVLGALIMGIVRNGLVLIGTSAMLQELFVGIVIVLAVIVNIMIGRSGK